MYWCNKIVPSFRINKDQMDRVWQWVAGRGDIGRPSDGQNTSSIESEIRTNTWVLASFYFILKIFLIFGTDRSSKSGNMLSQLKARRSLNHYLMLKVSSNLVMRNPKPCHIWVCIMSNHLIDILIVPCVSLSVQMCWSLCWSLWADVCSAPLIVWWAMRHS